MTISKEISITKLIKFVTFEFFMFFYNLLICPPLRKIFLKIFGARVGKNTIIHNTSFFNLYRKGFSGLKIGKKCFIGNECLFDLADALVIGDNVTLAERVIILTHLNVGYKNHPLQKHFPKFSKPVVIKEGSFIGAGSIILPGVTIGKNSLVGAGSVVTKDIPNCCVVAGNPAKLIRRLQN